MTRCHGTLMLDTIVNSLKYTLDRIFPNKHDPQVRRRALCVKLRDLHSSLRKVIATGNAIGMIGRSSFGDFDERDTRTRISQLSQLLQEQNHNIREVSNQLRSLEPVLRIKLPSTTESLSFYIPIKGNVIAILAAAADRKQYETEDPIMHRTWWYRTDEVDSVVEGSHEDD